MARAVSDDLRSRVLAAQAGRMSARSVASRFGIGIFTAIAWIARVGQGQLTAAKQGRLLAPDWTRMEAKGSYGTKVESSDFRPGQTRQSRGAASAGNRRFALGRHGQVLVSLN
ncbi:hypothetical protein FHT71_000327 [Rhizobium sp. BK060]|nr:hypothetical protein [Rhizobium sp. BK060]